MVSDLNPTGNAMTAQVCTKWILCTSANAKPSRITFQRIFHVKLTVGAPAINGKDWFPFDEDSLIERRRIRYDFQMIAAPFCAVKQANLGS